MALFDTVASRPNQGRQSRVELGYIPPFDAAAVLGNLRAHLIAGAETVDDDTITRLVTAPSGPVAVAITLTPDAVRAEVGSTDQADVAAVTAIIRRWFDLDLDPAGVASALGGDPVIGPLLQARPGLRVVGSTDGFETAVMTVLGQQVSLAAARTFGARLVAAFGDPGPGGLALFPAAEVLASVAPDELRAAVGLTGARARTLHGLAVACASGLQLAAGSDPVEFRHRLLGLPGIGPWTADYLAVRVLGDRDAFTASDLVLRRSLGGVSAAAAEAASQAWRPYRAYALFHLWTATSY
ncbi:MAG TPA: AlkA N-terminal domain-containing protein [Homoserinimonas sp.]|nr:AlkA N-terminal domain-containing protein [Homoserinimonas sp.]